MSSVGPLKVKRVHHLSRTTTNVKRLTDFYINVMGFKEIPRPTFGFGGSWLQLGDIQLHVIARNPDFIAPEDPFNNNGKPRSGPIALTRGHHIAFLTDKFDEIRVQLQHLGIEYYEGIITKEGRMIQIWFYDPDGNGIEILQLRKSKL